MCITDDEVLDDMKKNEAEKAEVEVLKTRKRMEREEKRKRENEKEREDGKENERLENKTNCEKAAAIEIKQKG